MHAVENTLEINNCNVKTSLTVEACYCPCVKIILIIQMLISLFPYLVAIQTWHCNVYSKYPLVSMLCDYSCLFILFSLPTAAQWRVDCWTSDLSRGGERRGGVSVRSHHRRTLEQRARAISRCKYLGDFGWEVARSASRIRTD